MQPLYLYLDFSGYTDIAIGLAKSFGISVPRNFNRPYLAENISNFWKRFHISLSSWFHDYVFIRTIFRYRKWRKQSTVIALFITWILFGIWHGAGWNFMFLGLLQALAIYFEFLTKKWRAKVFLRIPGFWRRWLGRLVTYFFYSISLVFFFSPDLRSGFLFLINLPFSSMHLSVDIFQWPYIIIMVFIIFLIGLEIIQEDYNSLYKNIFQFLENPKIKGCLLYTSDAADE